MRNYLNLEQTLRKAGRCTSYYSSSRMKTLSLLAGLFITTASLNSDTISGRLCKDNEEIVFSFLLAKNKKVVSLCKDKQGKYLVYRFGTKDKIELEYPQKLDTTSWKAFELYGAKRFGGKTNAGFGDYNLSFTNNNVTYKIFQTWDDESNTSSIGVIAVTDKKEVILKGDKKSKEGSLLRLDDDQDKISNTAYDEN